MCSTASCLMQLTEWKQLQAAELEEGHSSRGIVDAPAFDGEIVCGTGVLEHARRLEAVFLVELLV